MISQHQEKSFFVKVIRSSMADDSVLNEIVGIREKHVYRQKILRIFPDGYKLIPEPPKNNYSEVEDMFGETELVRFTSVAKFMFDVVSDIFSFNVVRKHKQTQRLYLDEVTFKSPQVREIRSWIERAIHRIQQLKAQATQKKSPVAPISTSKLNQVKLTRHRARTSSASLYRLPDLDSDDEGDDYAPTVGVDDSKLLGVKVVDDKSKGKGKGKEKASPSSDHVMIPMHPPMSMVRGSKRAVGDKPRKPRKFVVTKGTQSTTTATTPPSDTGSSSPSPASSDPTTPTISPRGVETGHVTIEIDEAEDERISDPIPALRSKNTKRRTSEKLKSSISRISKSISGQDYENV